jgi:hypothetical protein
MMVMESYRRWVVDTRYRIAVLYGFYPVIACSASNGYIMERFYSFACVSYLKLISRFRCKSLLGVCLRQKSDEFNFGNQALFYRKLKANAVFLRYVHDTSF